VTPLVQHLLTRPNKTESELESWAHLPPGVLTISNINPFFHAPCAFIFVLIFMATGCIVQVAQHNLAIFPKLCA